jgi:NAD(P)-dependent dehydrogenase (short-subunit alcohol dehydrogenase family)
VAGLLQDKVVVVAGHGSGLGASLARRSAAHGARLVLARRNARRLEQAAAELRADGAEVLTHPIDLEDHDAHAGLVEATLAAYGRADVLFNNAFRMPPMDPLTQVDQAAVLASVATNVLAPVRLTAAFADALAATEGNVVMVNSAVLYQSQPEFAAYKLTKGALQHATESLATELGARGIRVNSLVPSYIYEDLNKAWFDHLAAERGVTHQDVYDEKAAATDLKRLATADDVADAGILLASPLARAVTGVRLDAGCGEFHR